MTFQLEHITSSISGKTYLLVKCGVPDVRFKLSDHSFLGGVAIEKWYDIPKSVDNNGVARTDLLSFALKNEADKDQLKEGDTLKLFDAYTDVIETGCTMSGKMLVILTSCTGVMDIDIILSNNSEQWRIIKNNQKTIGRPSDIKLQKQIAENFWVLYFIEPINHNLLPDAGSRLSVTPPPNR